MAKRKGRSYIRKALLALVVISLGLVVILALLYSAVKSDQQVSRLLDSVNNISSIARYLRWAVIGGVILFWNEIIDYLSITKGLDSAQGLRAKSMRWHVFLAVIAFEVLVVEALPAKLLSQAPCLPAVLLKCS